MMLWLEKMPCRLAQVLAVALVAGAFPAVRGAAAEAPAPAAAGSASNAAPVMTGLFSEQIETPAAEEQPWADLAEIWRKTPEADASPVEKLTLPIEHYDNGRVRAVLHAGRAAVGREGLIWSWQVRVDLFDADGQENGHIEAATCLYDRNARRGYCPDAVTLVRTNATISGVGLYWSMSDQRMRIFSKPVVTMARGARLISGGTAK